jgi:signal transduction histidine kinase
MNPFSSVGAKLSLALAGVVTLALMLVYLVVVPSLRQRLVDAKLGQLERALPQVVQRVPQTQVQSWPDFVETASARANARVVVFEFRPAVGATGHAELGGPIEDSSGVDSRDVVNDPIARRAADTLATASGTVVRGDTEFAEVAGLAPTSLLQSGGIVLLRASLEDALANVHTVQRRLLEAGVLALALAVAVGYGAAYLFARRIRRLEAAAERIAVGRFDEPVIDRSADELGQLARAFDRMRLRLSQFERARREFIGNASHELRTPLFSLRGFIELLTDEELDDATRREFLATMREQVDRLQRLAEDLLDLTRLDAGRMHIEHRPIDLRELAEDLCAEFRAVALSTGHELELDAGEAGALGDEGRVLRIGRALLENAFKHTPSGTRVCVRSSGSSLAVVDEGPGIPAEHAGHVFDRFYRVDGTHASGSGLGLAIARELAEAMGGTLELESADGRTAFTLRLPAAAGADAFPRENVAVG